MSIPIRAIQSLQAGSVLWDTTVRGFGVRRQRRDAFYVLKYRVSGKQRFVTIGHHGSPWTPDSSQGSSEAPGTSREWSAFAEGETLEAVMEAYLAKG
jgi:hypothetical protein